MRKYAVAIVAALATTPALAGPYLFELMDIEAYRASWNDLFKGENNVPAWLAEFSKTRNGVATPSEDVEVGGRTYVSASLCKPHDCGDNMLYVFFSPLGEDAWAMLVESGGAKTGARFFGHPDKVIADALKRAAANQ